MSLSKQWKFRNVHTLLRATSCHGTVIYEGQSSLKQVSPMLGLHLCYSNVSTVGENNLPRQSGWFGELMIHYHLLAVTFSGGLQATKFGLDSRPNIQSQTSPSLSLFLTCIVPHNALHNFHAAATALTALVEPPRFRD